MAEHDDTLITTPQPVAPRARPLLLRPLERVGVLSPRDGADPYAHRRGEPRGLVAYWLIFLMLASLASFASVGGLSITSLEGYRLAVKVLLTVVGGASVLLWPMLRLSQRRPLGGGVRAVRRDLLVLFVPAQAVIWPQALLTGWSAEAVLVTALVQAAWVMGVGAIVAAVLGPPRFGAVRRLALDEDPTDAPDLSRAAAMACVAALVAVGPLLVLVLESVRPAGGGLSPRSVAMLLSPLTVGWETLSDRVWTGSRTRIEPLHWRIAALTGAAGLACWGVALVLRGGRPVAPPPERA